MLDGEDTDQGYIKAGKRGQQPNLPLVSALELGINASTLEIYAKCEGETLEMANFYYEQRGELKADMLKEIITVMREWPEKRDQ